MYLNPAHRRSPKNQIVINAFPDELTGTGLLNAITLLSPWKDDTDSLSFGVNYIARSGEKFIAPIVYHFLDKTTGEITQSGIQTLSTAIIKRYGKKWAHLYDLYETEYDPLD